MSEDGLVYRIEFEADEESLVDAIGDAIISTKPAIQYMIQSVINESLENSIREAVKQVGPVKIDVEVGTEYRREVTREARRESPVEPYRETVGDLLRQTSDAVETAGRGDMAPIITSAISMLVSQVMSYFRENPADASRIIETPASSVMVQESRYGDLSVVLRALSRLVEDIEDLDILDRFPATLKDDLISIIGRERGMEIVTREIAKEQPDAIVKTMTVGQVMDIMNVKAEGLGDISDIVRTEVAVALSRDGRVTIAQYEPIVEREEQEKFNRVIEFLQREISPFLTSFISSERAKLGEEFGVNIGRVVDTIFKSYGAFVSDRGERDTRELGRGAIPLVGEELIGLPRASEPAEINLDPVIEALNRLINALYNIGERDAAHEVRGAVNLLDRMKEHHRSEDHDG